MKTVYLFGQLPFHKGAVNDIGHWAGRDSANEIPATGDLHTPTGRAVVEDPACGSHSDATFQSRS